MHLLGPALYKIGGMGILSHSVAPPQWMKVHSSSFIKKRDKTQIPKGYFCCWWDHVIDMKSLTVESVEPPSLPAYLALPQPINNQVVNPYGCPRSLPEKRGKTNEKHSPGDSWPRRGPQACWPGSDAIFQLHHQHLVHSLIPTCSLHLKVFRGL